MPKLVGCQVFETKDADDDISSHILAKLFSMSQSGKRVKVGKRVFCGSSKLSV
jgi:hypothetical protein